MIPWTRWEVAGNIAGVIVLCAVMFFFGWDVGRRHGMNEIMDAQRHPTAGPVWAAMPGEAPTTPRNGDIWVTSAGYFSYNGRTMGPFATFVEAVQAMTPKVEPKDHQ